MDLIDRFIPPSNTRLIVLEGNLLAAQKPDR